MDFALKEENNFNMLFMIYILNLQLMSDIAELS